MKLAKGIAIAFITICAQSATATLAAETPFDLIVKKDVCYSNVDNQPLNLDIIRLSAKAPQPLVLCIHGGGWAAGDKHEMLETSLGLAKVGFCVANINYRLAPKNKFPAAVRDVKTALKFMQDHAVEYNIDPRKIGVVGGSAGAHLALMMATTTADINSITASSASNPSAVKAAVSISGPTNLSAPLPQQSIAIVESFIGKKRQEAPALCREASPITFVSKYSAPMLLIQGDKDEIVPYSQAVEMQAKCQKVGVNSALITLHNRGHADGGDAKENEAAIRALVEFLLRNLR